MFLKLEIWKHGDTYDWNSEVIKGGGGGGRRAVGLVSGISSRDGQRCTP